MPSLEEIRQTLAHELAPNFVEGASNATAWNYRTLYDNLAAEAFLTDDVREEEFNRRRGECATRALASAATRHGVPFEFRKLESNGQRKILVKSGRIIMIQETIVGFSDSPAPAEYKRNLANLHGFVRQLELDLRDQPGRISDWSGCILCVLLHGSAGGKFTRTDKSLGNLLIGVPDAAYQQWTARIDLHTIALYGKAAGVDLARAHKHEVDTLQTDDVLVTPKRKNSKKNAGEL